MVSEDYWMTIQDGSHTLISAACPSEVCCQLSDGCDYVEDTDYLCASNRDSDTYLCSRCNDGYSESMNSANCTKCTRSVHWEYLALPLCMALVIVSLLLYSNREKPPKEDDEIKMVEIVNARASVTERIMLKAKPLKDDRVSIAMGSLVEIVVYYQQVK